MSFIIKHETDKLQQLQNEIELLRSTMTDFGSNKEFIEQNDKMMKNLYKLELSIMQVKRSVATCNVTLITAKIRSTVGIQHVKIGCLVNS